MTTLDADGGPHLAPMGPQVDEHWETLLLRPFQTSTTFSNLQRHGEGVLHVTDDVELLARAAVNLLQETPPLRAAERVRGFVLEDCCRWYAFRLESIDASQPRSMIIARVVDHGRVRDFWGFNRGKHAVVEAAILATRTHLISAAEIAAEFARLRVMVDKTGGEQEHRAFALLENAVLLRGAPTADA